MLVLTRNCNQSIMIGDDIEITIVDIRGDKVRLGITAPNRAIHRREVWCLIKGQPLPTPRASTPPVKPLPDPPPQPQPIPKIDEPGMEALRALQDHATLNRRRSKR